MQDGPAMMIYGTENITSVLSKWKERNKGLWPRVVGYDTQVGIKLTLEIACGADPICVLKAG